MNAPQLSSEAMRRITWDDLDYLIDKLVDEFNVCDYKIYDFIAEICDTVVYEELKSHTNYEPEPKDCDNFYYYLLDRYGKTLGEIYKQVCND